MNPSVSDEADDAAPSGLALLRSFLHGTTFRYCCAGSVVMLWNLAVPLALNAALGISIEIAILIGYFTAVALQFTLQRLFVFRHVDEFALGAHQQAAIYVVIVAVQYPVYALSSAFLPGALGVSHRIVYVCTVLIVTVITYLLLRARVFHASPTGASPTGPSLAGEPIETAGVVPQSRVERELSAAVDGTA